MSIISWNCSGPIPGLPQESTSVASEVYVKIEAPGMESENFDIEVQDNTLIVRGEKRVQSEKTEGRYHLMECAYGSFERAMQLPANVGETDASASYKKGILKITLPKVTHTRSNRINVT